MLSSVCEDSLLHLAFLSLDITVNTSPCKFFLGLPVLPIEGTCDIPSTMSIIKSEMDVNFPPVTTFPLVPLLFALIWVANSCSFGSPASPISSLADSSILPQTSLDIEILNELSKCIGTGMVEDILSNITGSILREAFAMKGDSLDDLRQQFLGQDRLPPIVSATEVSGTRLRFENTKHRYSWICSLRRRDAGRQHLCSVTLLARPPRQTVIVGAAHCTFLCRIVLGQWSRTAAVKVNSTARLTGPSVLAGPQWSR